ncbi:hypothetical protein BA768_00465 [Chryseobacterium sp. CBo1]|uniref:hypothetical protein n=1 Tax=Chryseobacterium sp. CBo1 TaxID=1869230 RepID=UPI00081047E4|nr:hypothetical protein [Chryseobacterium sp. CBo1]OCK53064.1 hypothetical protein BA768_00465 [Chryseobacterium sp. CBo1]
MIKLYKICNWLLFAFAVLHFVYPFFDTFQFDEELMWYHSGGLSMLLIFSINYINSNSTLKMIQRIANLCNVATALFIFFLCIAVPEIQVYVLSLIISATTIISFRKSFQTNIKN